MLLWQCLCLPRALVSESPYISIPLLPSHDGLKLYVNMGSVLLKDHISFKDSRRVWVPEIVIGRLLSMYQSWEGFSRISSNSGGKAAWEALPAGWCYVPWLGMFSVPGAASNRPAYLGPSTMRFERTHSSSGFFLVNWNIWKSTVPSPALQPWAIFPNSARILHLRFCAVAGITSDANVLINRLRLTAQQHAYSFSEAMPVEQLVTSICDYKLLRRKIFHDHLIFSMGLLRQQMWGDISW